MDPLTASQLLPAGLIVMIAATIQSAMGFAFSLFCIPLLLGVGLSLPQAIGVAVVPTLFQRVHMCIHLRRDIKWRKVLPLAPPALIGLPIGLWLLTLMVDLPPAYIKATVGAVILALVIVRVSVRIEPREHVHWAWGQMAGLSSGILRGIVNAGGPPMVLWTYAHKWTNPELRVSAVAVSLVSAPAQVALLWFEFGSGFPIVCGQTMALAPVTLLGGWAGVHLGHRIPPERLRPIAYTLLIVIGLKSVLAPWL